jgi:hypothetical protein
MIRFVFYFYNINFNLATSMTYAFVVSYYTFHFVCARWKTMSSLQGYLLNDIAGKMDKESWGH